MKKYIPIIFYVLFILILYVIGYEIDSGPIRRDSGFGYNNFKNVGIPYLIKLILIFGFIYTISLIISLIVDFLKMSKYLLNNNKLVKTTQNYADLLNSDVGEQVGRAFIQFIP